MRRNITRRDAIKGAGIAGVAGLAGCVGGGGGGGRTAQYGVLMPLTGDLGSVGKPMRDAAVLPEAQLKDADLGGLSVKVTVEDTQTDPSAGISAANSLVNAGVPGICGPASSGVNIQVSKQVFTPNKVVGCSPSSTSPAVTDLDDNDYVWRTAPSDALQGKVMGQVATEKLNGKTAATLFVNNDYGQLLSENFVQAFKEQGGSVQKQVAFAKQQSSYTAKLQSALQNDPDVLVVIGYPDSGVQIFKDYYADFEAKHEILVTDGLQDATLPKKVGNPMKNVTGTAPKPTGPSNKQFTKLFKDEYDTAPGIFTAHSYDASAVLVLANAAAGKNDGTAVRDNMMKVANPEGKKITADSLAEGVRMAKKGEDINYQGASSPVNFDDNGDMKAVAYSVWKFAPKTESGIKVVDTINFSA